MTSQTYWHYENEKWEETPGTPKIPQTQAVYVGDIRKTFDSEGKLTSLEWAIQDKTLVKVENMIEAEQMMNKNSYIVENIDLRKYTGTTLSSVWLSQCIFFHKENEPYGEFSQWYYSPFKDGQNRQWYFAEEYMMYHKAETFKNQTVVNEILSIAQTTPPSDADGRRKRLANVKNLASSAATADKTVEWKIWEEIRVGVVKQANFLKFNQNETLKQTLLNTENSILIEAAPNDAVWGIGKSASDAKKIPPYDLFNILVNTKKNLLGKVLRDTRNQIRGLSNNQQQAVTITPSDTCPVIQDQTWMTWATEMATKIWNDPGAVFKKCYNFSISKPLITAGLVAGTIVTVGGVAYLLDSQTGVLSLLATNASALLGDSVSYVAGGFFKVTNGVLELIGSHPYLSAATIVGVPAVVAGGVVLEQTARQQYTEASLERVSEGTAVLGTATAAGIGGLAWLASQRNGILIVTSVVFLIGFILFSIGLFNMTRNFLFAPRGGNVNKPQPSPDPNNNIPTCKAVPCTPVPCQPVVNPTPQPAPQPQPVVNVQNNDVTMNQIRAMIENQMNQSGIPTNNNNNNNQPLTLNQIQALIASELQRTDSMGCDDPCGQNSENPSPTTNFS